MQPTRGCSVTVYGIVGGNDGELIHMTADRTDSDNTQAFLQQFLHLTAAPHDEIVIVADNHSAHKSQSTQRFLERHNVRLLHLPPYSSPLNPIEHVWSAFKSRWRSRMAQQLTKVPPEHLARMVTEVMDQVRITPRLFDPVTATVRRVLNDELV